MNRRRERWCFHFRARWFQNLPNHNVLLVHCICVDGRPIGILGMAVRSILPHRLMMSTIRRIM